MLMTIYYQIAQCDKKYYKKLDLAGEIFINIKKINNFYCKYIKWEFFKLKKSDSFRILSGLNKIRFSISLFNYINKISNIWLQLISCVVSSALSL